MEDFSTVTVLIVDPDDSRRLEHKKILQKHCIRLSILEADSVEQALERLKKDRIVLVLLDLFAPSMQGFDIAKKIQEQDTNHDIPIIFTASEKGSEIFAQRGFEMGAVDYLVLPLDTNLLINRIKLYLTLFSQRNELRKINHEAESSLEMINKYVIASKTDLKGIITEVTDAFCDISGYKREELIGKPHNIVRHPDMPSEVFKEAWSLIKKGMIWSGKVKNRRKDGSFYWVFAVISPLLNLEGEQVGYISTRQDITALKLQKEELLKKEKRLEDEIHSRQELEEMAHEILDTSENLIAVAEEGSPLFLNKAMLTFVGAASVEQFIKNYGSLNNFFKKEPNLLEALQVKDSWLNALLEISSDKFFKMRPVGSDKEYTYSLKVKRFDNREDRYLFIFSDVTRLDEERTYYQELATHDTLTGIYNRFYVMDVINREIASAKRHENIFSVLMVDVDHFKEVNDNFGHNIGDIVLKEFAHVIKSRLRETDIFARWGGEEFIIVLPLLSGEKALRVAQDIGRTVREHSFKEVNQVKVSVGVSEYKADDDMNSLVNRADHALYQAKDNGRDQSILF